MALPKFVLNNIWNKIPAWKDVSIEEFGNDRWQLKNSVINITQIANVLGNRLSRDLFVDMQLGQKFAPMNIRVTPYIFSLIDWRNPHSDPLRKQFIPLGSDYLPDHPFKLDDSLAEDEDSPVPLITHRYPDKVLFLPVSVCPVYCAFCTRSRLVGGSNETKIKNTYGATPKSWTDAFEYLKNNKMIEDVVISGGDAFQIPARHIETIGKQLLQIPNIKRIRYGTKGIAVLPMKILTDDEWVNALHSVKRFGDELGKQVAIHTHFNHPTEITEWSKMALDRLNSLNIKVRNQSVLVEGVNDNHDTMKGLIKKLISINVEPYYIYLHDMVGSCEHLRTRLIDAVELSKSLQGMTAGFNLPKVICDLPGGGGKQLINSYEFYDQEFGVSIWASAVKKGKIFRYYDPVNKLSKSAQAIWNNVEARTNMLNDIEKRFKEQSR